ncbi:MAG: outer membrane protein assembly factor BamA, partial [Chryseobacterium sp.]|nr:outer membrane protein assembly factor BamA [Chryseobacterium sp.]
MKFKFLPIIMFVASAHIYGQVTPQPNQENNPVQAESSKGTYVLRDIIVDGVKKYSADQILRFTGLSKGESVEIPGQKISNAIKKLWETDNFSEVEVYVESIEGESVVLRFNLQDLKELGEVKFTGKGISKSKSVKLAKDNNLKPGAKITQNLVATLKTNIPKEYIKKGFPDANVTIEDKVNAKDSNLVDWTINVDKGKRIKIDHIEFEGNTVVSDRKLRKKAFKETKQKSFSIAGILKPSKFIESKYVDDKQNLINYYNSLGFRDAKIVSDSVYR